MTAVPSRPAAPDKQCRCGHDGLPANFHMTPCPIKVAHLARVFAPEASGDCFESCQGHHVGDGITSGGRVHHMRDPYRLTAPDATAGDGLREAIAEALWRDDSGTDVPLSSGRPGTQRTYTRIADTLIGGPLRDVLAAAARAAEKVRRVESVHVSDEAETAFCDECGHAWPCLTIRALNGPQ